MIGVGDRVAYTIKALRRIGVPSTSAPRGVVLQASETKAKVQWDDGVTLVEDRPDLVRLLP